MVHTFGVVGVETVQRAVVVGPQIMSLKETIVNRVTEYLESTTIHGFSYLTSGRHVCERVVWLIIIGTCFTLAALLIHQSIEEANQNPVMTNVESIPLQDIPFPAITINSGDPDPLGYAENTFNGLIFDQGLSEANDKELRNMFSSIIDDIVCQLNSSFRMRNSHYTRHDIPSRFIFETMPKLRELCLNQPDEKELIDQRFTEISKELILDGRDIDKVFDQYLATVDLDHEYVGIISNTSCEKWAEHLVFFFINLYQNQQAGSQKTTLIGFGSFVTYFDYLSKTTNTDVPDKFMQFLSNYSKLTGVSERLERMDATSFDFVAWMMNWLRLNNFEFNGWKKNCPGLTWVPEWMPLCHNLSDFRREYSLCCDVFSFESLNMSSLYQIMRESMQSPVFLTNPLELIERGNVIANLPFPNILQKEELTERFLKKNPNARVYACNYAGENPPSTSAFKESMSCPHFHRSITTNGFGISFNVADFWSIYKESPFTKTFVEVMKPKTNPTQQPKNLASDQHVIHRGKNILFPEKLGKSNEMLLVLQSKWTREQKTSEKFRLTIHDPLHIPNMLDAGDEILPGALTSITVWPQLIETSNDLVSHTIEERGCQFNFEGSSQLFTNNYHQEGCIFECLLELSYSTMNCTPWNYPFFKPHQQTCNFYAVYEFEKQMRDSSSINQCQAKCPQECTKMLYTTSISSEPFDWQGMCDQDLNYVLYFDPNPFYQYSQPIGIIKSYEQMVFNKNMSNLEFCKETLKRLAVVRIKLASNTVTAIKRSKRVTITGHISNIGGTLGLFTGMSIMSFIELTFWLCRFLHSLKKHCS